MLINLKRSLDCFYMKVSRKQGYALKSWVEGLSDEANYPALIPESPPQKLD